MPEEEKASLEEELKGLGGVDSPDAKKGMNKYVLELLGEDIPKELIDRINSI